MGCQNSVFQHCRDVKNEVFLGKKFAFLSYFLCWRMTNSGCCQKVNTEKMQTLSVFGRKKKVHFINIVSFGTMVLFVFV